VRITRQIALAAGLVLVLMTAAPALAAPVRHHRTHTARQLVVLINHARVARGLRPLRISWSLVWVARAHSRDMMRRQYFAHGAAVARLARSMQHAHFVGETLAWGSGLYGTPRVIMAMWLASPSHRSVILDPTFTYIGIGGIQGRFLGHDGARVYTADFGG
jgi:uncharacterized protein YkwD